MYLDCLCRAPGHYDRESGLNLYCQWLMLPILRKNVGPLAAHVETDRVSARHQLLRHFMTKSEWCSSAA